MTKFDDNECYLHTVCDILCQPPKNIFSLKGKRTLRYEKPHAGGHLPYTNIKLGKLNTPKSVSFHPYIESLVIYLFF